MIVVKLVPTFWLTVAGKDDTLCIELSKSSFDRDSIGISVADFEQFIIFNPSVEIVHDDQLVLFIAIPPLSSRFVIGRVGVELLTNSVCKSRLTTSSFSCENDHAGFFVSCFIYCEDRFKFSDFSVELDEGCWKFLSNLTDLFCLLKEPRIPVPGLIFLLILLVVPIHMKSFSLLQYSMFCWALTLAFSRCGLERLNRLLT